MKTDKIIIENQVIMEIKSLSSFNKVSFSQILKTTFEIKFIWSS